MKILLVQTTSTYFIVLTIIIILIVALLFLLGNLKKRKPKESPLDLNFLEALYIALGGGPNILGISREHQRLQVKVLQMKSVDANKLKELGTPAFVKGKEITLLIKNHTQDVLSFLNDRRKEDS
ncbi:MAG: hypothetical protein K9L02_07700 [Acholeplasmataceae bacterium]|nr:hypothetical protein [Acholeplasmataceae bacterium]